MGITHIKAVKSCLPVGSKNVNTNVLHLDYTIFEAQNGAMDSAAGEGFIIDMHKAGYSYRSQSYHGGQWYFHFMDKLNHSVRVKISAC